MNGFRNLLILIVGLSALYYLVPIFNLEERKAHINHFITYMYCVGYPPKIKRIYDNMKNNPSSYEIAFDSLIAENFREKNFRTIGEIVRFRIYIYPNLGEKENAELLWRIEKEWKTPIHVPKKGLQKKRTLDGLIGSFDRKYNNRVIEFCFYKLAQEDFEDKYVYMSYFSNACQNAPIILETGKKIIASNNSLQTDRYKRIFKKLFQKEDLSIIPIPLDLFPKL